MSVIAKLSIRQVKPFGMGQAVELGCVCANDLMAAYATTEEDKLFTKYSPWGEMTINQPGGFGLGKVGEVFYAVVLRGDEAKRALLGEWSGGNPYPFPGAYVYTSAHCRSMLDMGDNQAKTVEFVDHLKDQARGIDRLAWKMSVDNPGATDQFKPGASDYFIALYPEEKFDRDAAIAAAHGRLTDKAG